MKLINITNASSPTFLRSYDTRAARGVFIQNSIAYVADGLAGIQFINISEPSNSRGFLGNYDTPGRANSITIHNNMAYVADGPSGMQILNLGKIRLRGMAPTNTSINYSFTIRATNIQSEVVSTNFELHIREVPSSGNTSIISESSQAFSVLTSESASIPQSATSATFSIIVSTTPITLEIDTATLLTTDILTFSDIFRQCQSQPSGVYAAGK